MEKINVYKHTKIGFKIIWSSSKWFDVDYYIIFDNGIDCLTFTKCYLEIPKKAVKSRKGRFDLRTDIPIGKYEFDEESDEDKLIIYYN